MKPAKKYSARKNGEGFKVFKNGEYIGSISLNELGAYVLKKNNKSPEKENAQIPEVTDDEYNTFLEEKL
jgi:hypothetical protein